MRIQIILIFCPSLFLSVSLILQFAKILKNSTQNTVFFNYAFGSAVLEGKKPDKSRQYYSTIEVKKSYVFRVSTVYLYIYHVQNNTLHHCCSGSTSVLMYCNYKSIIYIYTSRIEEQL